MFCSEMRSDYSWFFSICVHQDQVNEWANMTGFLCALGGVCLQRPRQSRPANTVPAAPSTSSGTVERKSNVSLILFPCVCLYCSTELI